MTPKALFQSSELRCLLATSVLLFASLAQGCRSPQAEEADDDPQYSGMCDASAAVALDEVTFIVADDESNTFGIYRKDRPGPPVQQVPWDTVLAVERDKDGFQEVDIEGAARRKNVVYWISSHGRNKDGKWRSDRHRFFAMTVRKDNDRWAVAPFGTPYDGLAIELADFPALRHLELNEALAPDDKKVKKLAPKKRGFNIEGLCTVPGTETLLIALRNPRPDGKALIVPLLNPVAVLTEGASPRFGECILLDLSFRHGSDRLKPGIRSMAYSTQEAAYLLVAGPHDEQDVFAVFRWSGKPEDQPQLLSAATAAVSTFNAFCPEAMIVYPQSGVVQVLSDDGSREVTVHSPAECKKGAFEDGKCEAKSLLDSGRKTFRSRTLPISRAPL